MSNFVSTNAGGQQNISVRRAGQGLCFFEPDFSPVWGIKSALPQFLPLETVCVAPRGIRRIIVDGSLYLRSFLGTHRDKKFADLPSLFVHLCFPLSFSFLCPSLSLGSDTLTSNSGG